MVMNSQGRLPLRHTRTQGKTESFLMLSLLVERFFYLLQGSANYGSLAEFDMPTGFVNKVLLEFLVYILSMVAFTQGKVE